MKIRDKSDEAANTMAQESAGGRYQALEFTDAEWWPVEVVLCEEVMQTLERVQPGVYLCFSRASLKVMIRALERLRLSDIAKIRSTLPKVTP